MGFLQNKQAFFQASVIFLLAVIQYSNTANHDYAWDDAIVITENSRVQKGLSDIPELFENIRSERTENRYGYRPIALLSFATDVELFGMNPTASHKVNILFYGILCALIFFFINSMFRVEKAHWAVFAVVALFVVHPLHTEVVSNIKSRDEILALIFGLLGLFTLRRALVDRSVVFYLLTAFSVVLAFNSKESGITFCGVAFLMPFYVNKAAPIGWRKVLIGVGIAFATLALLLLIRNYVYSEEFFQSNDWDLIYKGLFIQDGFIGNPLWEANIADRLATAVYLSGYGVYRFIVPYPLLHDYSYNMFSVMSWSDMKVYFALAVVSVFILATIYGLLKRKAFGFGLAFFFITHSIYLHLAHIGPDIFAERYLFVPTLGLCIALLSLFELKRFAPQKITAVLLILTVPLFAYSWQRNPVWKNNETLLVSDLARLDNCARANYNYALLLHGRYYQSTPQVQLQDSILHYYEMAAAITDRLLPVYMDLGGAYMEFGAPNKALRVFLKACEKYPNLSVPFMQMGKYYMSLSQYEKAIPYFEKALVNGNQNMDYYYLLAICQFNANRQETALETLDRGEEIGNPNAPYYILMVNLNGKMGQTEKAQNVLANGLKSFPTNQALLQLKNVLQIAK
ncbi:tetratricopeptide repeat protein [bacterium]|nr:tetratricopeptide repeat protein [bacterium]